MEIEAIPFDGAGRKRIIAATMNEYLTREALPRGGVLALARLGASHGYCFAGDRVTLNGMFQVANPAAHERAWFLQLWACPEAPASGGPIGGHLVAEAPLPPIGEIADETHGFEVETFATPPAGKREHVMVLALAAGWGREAEDLHDFAVYAQRQIFAGPRLRGGAKCQMQGGRARVSVEGIENSRPSENVSGTLSLELWALAEAYGGGAFEGAWVAGVTLGSLAGKAQWDAGVFDLTAVAPPAGLWRLTLMLREWTSNGYVTRDFFNFDAPFIQAAPVPKALPPAAKAESSEAARKIAAPVAPNDKRISVNGANAEQLAAVKGLPEKVAKGIVKERPFGSLEELTRVKGMGAKLLAKVRAHLKL